MTDITYPTLHATHFDYDADGRRTHMSDATGDTYWTYGDGVHLTQQSSNRGSVFYSYDGDGRRKTMVAPGLNPSVPSAPYIYGYDNGGRMTSLQNPFSETTGYAYNADNTLAKKTLANGASISYGYDAADQMTGLSYVFSGSSYSHSYTYTPGGSLLTRSEGDGGTNTFGYDGADQLVSEVRTGPVAFTHGYTYDHNGNRLTQTQNGTLVQSFTYNGHDVICPGINETFQFDLNGNETGDTLNGLFTRYAYDDEDRLIGITLPDGHTDSYTYNGLGLRLTKQDPSGYYAYYTDGTSPASDVLSDNFSTFTPGISEMGSLGSRFYLADASGNSRGLLDGSQGSTDGYNWDAFGTLMSRYGSHPTGYAWRAGSGYQTDNDTGLKLLGHRYYDTRIGRFLSQDPAGDGDNWYAYAGNDPVNNTDPTGLYTFIDPGMVGTPGDPGQFAPAGSSAGDGTWDQYQSDGQGGWKYLNTVVHGGAWDQMNGSSMGPGGFFMPRKGNVGDSRGLGGLNDELKGIQKALNDGGISKSERQAKENAIQKLEDAIKRTKKGLGQKGSRANKEAKTPPLSNEERAARDAAKAERRAAFESERAQLLDDAAVDTLELDAAEGALILDEGIIGIGIIVK